MRSLIRIACLALVLSVAGSACATAAAPTPIVIYVTPVPTALSGATHGAINPSNAPSDAGAPSPTPAPTQPSSVRSFSDDIMETRYTITATKATVIADGICPMGDAAFTSTYVGVTIEFAVEQGRVFVITDDFTVSDEDGYSYPHILCGYKFELGSGQVSEGRRVKGLMVFEVPKGTKKITLDYQAMMQSLRDSWVLPVQT